MISATMSPANFPMPLRPFTKRCLLGVRSPLLARRSRATLRYSWRSSRSVIPVPSSRTVIGSNVIASGSVIHTFGASASHALSTSSFKACSVDRYVSPSKVAKRGSTWKFACRDCTVIPSDQGYPFHALGSTSGIGHQTNRSRGSEPDQFLTALALLLLKCLLKHEIRFNADIQPTALNSTRALLRVRAGLNRIAKRGILVWPSLARTRLCRLAGRRESGLSLAAGCFWQLPEFFKVGLQMHGVLAYH